jgi:hypothetical protein
MNDQFTIFLAGNVVAILIAVGGWVCTYVIQRDVKNHNQMESRIKKLEAEIKARIILEEVTCLSIADLTSRPIGSIKLEMRDKAESSTGLRPKMSISNLKK